MSFCTRKFEGLYGVMHELIIEFEGDLNFLYELIETVEHSFFKAKEVIETEFKRFALLNAIETFPEKSLVDMVIYYESNGKYKNVISNYHIANSFNHGARITLSLTNPINCSITANDIARVTYSYLREPLWWEDYNKKFYNLEHNVTLIRDYLKQKSIMKCYYNDNVYFFNIGIVEPVITDDMIEEAIWFVYLFKEV